MESEAKMKEKEAQQFFDVLLNQGRYHEDVFGVVHKWQTHRTKVNQIE